jgi:predicted SprT family Zn-dependent metalloprotease
MADAHGRWIKHKHLIELQAPNKQNGMTNSFLVQVFWHEVVHAILDNIGKEDLSNDEQFVDQVGQLVHQVLKTKRNK